MKALTPVETATLEAKFALGSTVLVCLVQELGEPKGMAAAVILPIAMAFSVHGLHNAKGLRWWNLAYLPMRVAIILVVLMYSYAHWLEFLRDYGTIDLGPLGVLKIRQWAAIPVELLTLTALISHRGHSQIEQQASVPADDPVPVEDETPQADSVPLVDRPTAPSRPHPVPAQDDAPPVWFAEAIRRHVDEGWSYNKISAEVDDAPTKSSVGRMFAKHAAHVDEYRANRGSGLHAVVGGG